MNFVLIYPAIIVFSLVCIALVLTVLEFKEIKKEYPDPEHEKDNSKDG